MFINGSLPENILGRKIIPNARKSRPIASTVPFILGGVTILL